MNLRWASLLLGLLLLASLTACSDSQETVPRDEDRAWDEYVSWCSQASLEEPPGDEDQTYGEVSTFYAGVAESAKSASPPAEVADYHNKYVDLLDAMNALIDAEPQDEIFNPIDIFFDSEVVSLFEEVGEALNDMPEDARERLAAAGCLGDDASEPTGEGLSATPQPDSTAPTDSGRTSTDSPSMPKCEPRSSYEPALVAFYNATDGPNWKDNTNWLTDAPLGDWAGVSANRITGNGRVVGECVTQLWLNSNRLKGELPADLGSLHSLAELYLSNNQLSGAIPAELGSLLNLQRLDFSDNQLSGEIPAELGGLPNLQRLDLANNQLSGEIPAELGDLLNLQRLYLGRNQLSGGIPAAIGNLPNMIWLSLPDNQLSGAIPAELGNIPTLVLYGNRLTGRVLRPGGANPQYAWEGSTIRVSWEAVDGADYYKVYYDADFDSSCDLDSDGRLSFCEELATDVTGTTYVHTNPSLSENYYWVVSCNSDGCSHIDKEYPAQLIGPTPSGTEPSTQPGAVYSTPTPRATRAPTQTPAPSDTPTPVPTPTQARTPSDTPTPEPTPTQTPEPSTTPTPGPTPTHTPTPSTPPAGTIPSAPANVRFAHEDSTIHITWDPVAGADHYNIYHDGSFDSRCRLNRDGSAGFCEELARNIVGTSFVHTAPDSGDNYYWVVACNSGGCSEIDSKNPAAPAEAIPTAPVNARYAVEGSTIRVSWLPVAGADQYNIYHDDFFDSRCRLNRDGSAGFCEELARNVVGTTYVHTDPSSGDNYYWVVACNRGGCSEIDAGNPVKAPGTSSTEATSMPTASQELEFTEGESATRSIPENTPAGINVGAPVSAEGDGTLTYTLSGPDAASFTIVPTTGQVRTRDGVVYDYETKSRYTVTVGADDESGESDTIDVTIHIEDLVAACQPVRNLRTNHGDEYVTAKWTPAVQREGKASVLGYQVEMRRGDDGPWTGRRTLIGRGIGATTYGGLQNLQKYLFRIRPVNTESDCGWSPPFLGIPTTYPGPIYPTDRFGTEPVGAPDRYWRFVTQERCRYSADGITLDANCTYTYTGPDTSRIVLVFDDPSLGSCDIALAFSSLTAGSFVDDCFDAGVNTETPFDTSFKMPRSGPQTESDVDIPRAPRSKEEFDVLAWGRDDFIPGLNFGCLWFESDCGLGFKPGKAWRVGRDPVSGLPQYTDGDYTYENTGPSQGKLTFRDARGDSYVFTLDVEPSGNMRVTIADEEGESATWPGIFHADPALDLQLPVPPSWWAAAAIETDYAPEDWNSLESRIPTPRNPALPESPRDHLLERTLLGQRGEAAFGETELGYGFGYEKVGRNRAVVTIDFRSWCEQHPDFCEDLNESLEDLARSTWSFDLTFTSDGAARYTLTVTRDGHLPEVNQGFVDFKGDSIEINEFPEEIRLPLAPPQASGQDRSGVGVAAAISAPEIGGNDLQTFLISDDGLQPAAYQPGDWLEPKDGSNQRMMIAGVSQGTSAASTASRQPLQAWTSRYLFAFPSLEVAGRAVFHGMPTFQLVRFAPLTTSVFFSSLVVTASYVPASEPTITQLQVVCMQQDSDTYRIPTRGDRYFSQPKAAEGPVQLCQRDCALNETTNVQQCVWDCEER